MAVKTRILRIQSLVAYLQSESDGDEVFLRYKNKKIAPLKKKFYKMTREPLEINAEIKLDGSEKWVELELWEYDLLLPNTCLGESKLLVGQQSDSFSAELVRETDSQARYVLNWELLIKMEKKTVAPGKKVM